MHPDIALGISVELQTVLKPDWIVQEEKDYFVLTPPKTTVTDENKWRLLSEEVWRIARFVGYANFCSVSRTEDGGAEIVSYLKSGDGFKLIIQPN
jgi:hypothetical protein